MAFRLFTRFAIAASDTFVLLFRKSGKIKNVKIQKLITYLSSHLATLDASVFSEQLQMSPVHHLGYES